MQAPVCPFLKILHLEALAVTICDYCLNTLLSPFKMSAAVYNICATLAPAFLIPTYIALSRSLQPPLYNLYVFLLSSSVNNTVSLVMWPAFMRTHSQNCKYFNSYAHLSRFLFTGITIDINVCFVLYFIFTLFIFLVVTTTSLLSSYICSFFPIHPPPSRSHLNRNTCDVSAPLLTCFIPGLLIAKLGPQCHGYDLPISSNFNTAWSF